MSSRIEALEQALVEAQTTAERVDAQNALAWELVRSASARARELLDEVQQTLSSMPDPYPRAQIEMMRTRTRLEMYSGNFEAALAQAMEAAQQAETLGLRELLPPIWNTIAACYRQLGDLSRGLEYFLKQAQLCQELGSQADAGRALVGIGVIYYDMGDFENFLKYSEDGLAIFRVLDEDYWIGLALNNITYALYKLGRYAEASQRAQEGLKLLENTGNKMGRLRILNSLSDVYLAMGEPRQALEATQEILDEIQPQDDMDLLVSTYWMAGRIYVRLGEVGQALAFYEKALAAAEEHKLQKYIYEVNNSLAEFYRQQGDYQRALEHYERFHQAKEQVLSESSAQKARNLEVLYKTQAAHQQAEYFSRMYEQTRAFSVQLEEEVRRRTEDLRQAYDQLDRLDRTKSDFITVTAHELRTPLTVLRGYVQILQADPLIKEHSAKLDLVNGIQTGAERLSDIINTMLMMVKIDSRALEITHDPLLVFATIRTITNRIVTTMQERRQTLTLAPELEKLPAVEGDQAAIALVLRSIIENAVKYTPDGGSVHISGRAWETAPRPDLPAPAVEVIVSDTGIGIDPQDQQLIFTKFYRSDSALRHSTSKTNFKGGGPGLSLAISRGIVEAHHGKLWVESEGHDEEHLPGSRFHIILPLRQA